MTVYEAVVARLATLGYTATDSDTAQIEYLIARCESRILADINHRTLPDGLRYVLVDMAAGQLLFDKKSAGQLDGVEGFDFSAPAKSLTEGDVSVTLAGAGDGASTPEGRFDALLASMLHPDDGILAAYRRLRW